MRRNMTKKILNQEVLICSGASSQSPFLGATNPDGVIGTQTFRKNQDSNLAETNRLKALCDGVFAIIITLLVLEIHRPSAARSELGKELLKESGRPTLPTRWLFSMWGSFGSIITICSSDSAEWIQR
jgi:hypothetical protein